jgi:amidase
LELLDHTIARIEALDQRINAVVVRDFDRARTAAKTADSALARGEHRALLGVAVTLKEPFNVAGLPTTWGFPKFKDFVPTEDALAVTRLKQAGAIIIGKTNIPIGLREFQSYNEIYGTTNNPYDLGRSPGGSSGGSAAALAAGFGPLSLGSDIGGSIRVPAHFCGVFGHKPSLGLIPSRGYSLPPAPPVPGQGDLAVVGPMTRTASDLALSLDVIAGPDDARDGIGYRLALPAPRHDNPADFRVLVIDTHPLMPVSSAVRSAIAALAERLNRLGARVAVKSALLPSLADSARLYMKLLNAARSPRLSADAFAEAQRQSTALSPGDQSPEAERMRGTVMSHRDWLAADATRLQLQQQWHLLFREFDVMLYPSAPVPAFFAGPIGADRGTAARHRRQGVSLPGCVLHLGGSGHDVRPSRDRCSNRPIARGFAHWSADHRSLSRGPHHNRLRGTDRTRVRRVRASRAVSNASDAALSYSRPHCATRCNESLRMNANATAAPINSPIPPPR